jgi:DNA-binding NtrC family response regulator
MSGDLIRVFFCSPDIAFAEPLTHALGQGFQIRATRELRWPDPAESGRYDVLLLDLQANDRDPVMKAALEFLTESSQSRFPLPVVAILASEDRSLTLRLMELGVHLILTTPPDMIELRIALRRACRFHQLEKEAQELRAQEMKITASYTMVGAEGALSEVLAMAQKVAPCDVTVLITGETGTGKELWARAIHRMSSRATQPFVGFSCANLPETLIEDELFGHEKGAFTGATNSRRGRFELADRGTLFLDEIGDLSLGLQPKLLRVVQERSFERLGGSKPVAVDVRMICATHRDLGQMVEQGRFREDLYYRLNVVQLHLPPLRERRESIPELAHYFMKQFATQFGKKTKRFAPLALQALEENPWPGNVRELENVVQRAVVLAEDATIELSHLPEKLRKGFVDSSPAQSYDAEIREFKKRLVLRALRQCGWKKTETARSLGIARNYLHRLINQLNIIPEEAGMPPVSNSVPAPKSDAIM